MKFYGYASCDEKLLKLDEVTIQASVAELEQLIEFLKHTKELMESKEQSFGHEHLSDFCRLELDGDLILTYEG